jgi:putative membrane protein
MKPATMKRLLTEAAFALAVAATFAFMLHVGLRPIGQALSRIGFGGILLITLAHAPTLIVLGLSWWVLAGDAAGSRPAKFVWGRQMRDASGDLLPFSPVGGYLIGVRAVVLTGIAAADAAISSLLDILTEQSAKTPYMMVSAGLLLWLVPGNKLAAPALAFNALTLAAIAVAVMRWDWIRGRFLAIAAGVEQRWPAQGRADGRKAEAVLGAALADRGRIGASFCLQLVAWFLGAAEVWLALHLLGTRITYGEAVVIDGLYAGVRTLTFAVPSAAGVQEGSYVVLCAIFGLDAPTALAFSLVKRARDALVGGPAVLAWQLMERQRRDGRVKWLDLVRRAAARPLAAATAALAMRGDGTRYAKGRSSDNIGL